MRRQGTARRPPRRDLGIVSSIAALFPDAGPCGLTAPTNGEAALVAYLRTPRSARGASAADGITVTVVLPGFCVKGRSGGGRREVTDAMLRPPRGAEPFEKGDTAEGGCPGGRIVAGDRGRGGARPSSPLPLFFALPRLSRPPLAPGARWSMPVVPAFRATIAPDGPRLGSGERRTPAAPRTAAVEPHEPGDGAGHPPPRRPAPSHPAYNSSPFVAGSIRGSGKPDGGDPGGALPARRTFSPREAVGRAASVPSPSLSVRFRHSRGELHSAVDLLGRVGRVDEEGAGVPPSPAPPDR